MNIEGKGPTQPKTKNTVRRAKKADRRLYMKQYRQNRKKHRVRVELNFSTKEFARLKRENARHNCTVAVMLSKFTMAYLDRVYVVPDALMLRELRLDFRRIGNNLNQIAVKVNKTDQVFQADIRKMQERIQEVEEAVAAVFHKPVRLSELMRKSLKEHPEYLDGMKKIISEFEPG